MAVLRVRLSSEADDRIALQSPYDRAFVDGLKQAIPYAGRVWESDRKIWVIWPLYQQDLLDYLRQVGAQVQDDRQTAHMPASVPAMPEDLKQGFDTLHLAYTAPLGLAEMAYKFWSRYVHPDMGGDVAQFHAVNDAITTIRHYLSTKEDTDVDDQLPF